MSRMICLLPLLLLIGCASFTEEHSRTLLLDQKTGETEECTVGMMRTQEAYEKYKSCIKASEEKGYSVWNQY